MSGAPFPVEDGRLSELAASVYKETVKNGERQKKRRISCGVFERRGGGVRQPAQWWGGGLSESRPLPVGAVGSFLSHPAASLPSNKQTYTQTKKHKMKRKKTIKQTNKQTSKDIISQSRPLPMWAPSNRTGQPPYPKSQSPSGSPDSTPSHPETP